MAVSSNIQVIVEAPNEILTVKENQASKGGGLYFEMHSCLLVSKHDANTTQSNTVTFHNNSAVFGGAIYVTDNGM